MALSKDQITHIIALAKIGDLSNIAIGKEVGCGESAVRTTLKKNNVKKNELKELAQAEVQNIIIENEIKTRKNELNEFEKNEYDKLLLTEAQSSNLVMNAAQLLVNKMTDSIKKGSTQRVLKTKVYDGEGKVIGEEPFPVDVPHGANDHKSYAEALDKVSVTLGINNRFSTSPQVAIQNNQTIENNNTQMTKEEYEEEMKKRGIPSTIQTLT